MEAKDPKTVPPVGSENENMIGESQAQAAGDLCRCKETALMKPRQLFRLMLDDLAFWKKAKKG
jgi:hypothetical protein